MKPELAEVLELIRRDDADARERALALLRNTVFSFSMKVCGHREDAEDTSQEVLLRTLHQLPELTSPAAFAVWLYKVARSRCLNARRRSKFAPARSQELSLDELLPTADELAALATAPAAEAHLSARESRERLRHALLRLPPTYRLVLVLHDIEELDTPEVAEVLGLTHGTVRVRLHRARLALRRELMRPARLARAPQPARPDGRCRALFASLSDYLDGIVDDRTCARMREHLADCTPCQAFVASLERMIQQCRSLPGDCAPRLPAAVRKQLLREYLAADSTLRAAKRKPAAKR
jgi:RNA polymerase sigma-70 factor, ECF subfamily